MGLGPTLSAVPFNDIIPLTEVIWLLVVGLGAGILGGLLGIGGSIIMIPVLTLLFGHEQQLSQASAMIVNVFVAAPAVIRHRGARAIDWKIVGRMIPAGVIFVLIGVEISNELGNRVLQILFGAFLLYVVYMNIRKLLEKADHDDEDGVRRTWWAASTVGGIMGFAAGLLGIGGGIIAVPLLQRITRLPLRSAIACSATAMCLTSPFGAIRKNMDLASIVSETDEPLKLSLTIAACLAPMAIVGALFGARLTHTMPLRQLRIAFIVLLSLASLRFFGVF